jgi:serine/threonine-protein kinase
MARYLPTGHLVFGRDGFLFAVPFDIDSLEVRGNPVPVVENVMGVQGSGVVHASFARNGLLAFVADNAQSRQDRLVWRSRDGATEPLAAPVVGYSNPRISPDRKQIVVAVRDTTSDIWTYRLEQGTLTRLTFEGNNIFPIWSPDGRQIAFSSIRDNALTSAYRKAADGSGPAEMMYSPAQLGLPNAGTVVPMDWTADERHLIVQYADENSQNIGVVSEDGELRVVVNTPGTEKNAALSPNGRWLAYTSDETGEFQVFVQAFPGPGGKWQISNRGGNWPRWSPDGTELFYRWQTNLYAVPIDDSAGNFRFGQSEIVFDDLDPMRSDYDVLDSNRFLLVEQVGDASGPAGVTVVVNWFDELERLVPN